jgi:hypothetical protein
VSETFLALSSLGGVCALIGGGYIFLRGVFRQIDATKENTAALKNLTGKLEKQDGEIDDIKIRLGILEDRAKR